MIRETTWSPDTCGCVLTYTWDDADPQETRVHVYQESAKVCLAHARLLGKESHLDTVMEENQRKNHVLIYAAEIAGIELVPDKEKVRQEVSRDPALSQREKVVKIFNTLQALELEAQDFTESYTYQFDALRNLRVSCSGLTAQQKKQLQDRADQTYGKGKVTIG